MLIKKMLKTVKNLTNSSLIKPVSTNIKSSKLKKPKVTTVFFKVYQCSVVWLFSAFIIKF